MVLTNNIIEYALRIGADEVELMTSRTLNRSSQILGDKLTNTSSINIESIVRVVVDKSVASVRISTDEEAKLKTAVEKAINIAKTSPSDPYWESLPEPNKPTRKKLDTWNDDIATIDIEEMSEQVYKDYKYCKGLEGDVKLVGITYVYNESDIHILNSNGVDAQDKVNGLSYLIETKGVREGYEVTTFGYERSKKSRIDTQEVIEDTYKRNLELLNAEKYEGIYEGPVAMDPLATATTLFFSLAMVITGVSVVEGFSPFKDKVGEQITSSHIEIIDDGVLPGGWNTRYYDDEGYPRGTTRIVEDGILKNFIHNSYTANRLGQPNTGNAVRRGTQVTVGITNLILRGGERDTEKLLSGYDEIMLVRNMPMNAHTTNYVTGALNLVATELYFYKKGSLEKIVKPMTLSGNIYEAMKTFRLGNDVKHTFYNIITPTVVMEGLKMA